MVCAMALAAGKFMAVAVPHIEFKFGYGHGATDSGGQDTLLRDFTDIVKGSSYMVVTGYTNAH